MPINAKTIEVEVRRTSDVTMQERFRTDASLASNMARSLEYVYTQVVMQEHPDKPFGMGLVIPIDSSPGPGAETYVYYEMGGTATAVVLNTYADDEMPEVGLFARRHVGNIESIGNSWSYNVQDIAAAAMSPLTGNLTTMKPKLAERGHVQIWQDVGLFGDESHGWNGFLNHPNVPSLPAATSWFEFDDQASVDDCLAEVELMLQTPCEITNGVHVPNQCLVPKKVFMAWSFQRLSVEASDLSMTMLQWLQRVHPEVQFGWLLECDSANSDGKLTESVSIAFKGGDVDVVSLVRTQDFTQHEGRWVGLRFRTLCTSRIGGTKFTQPLSACVTSNVTQPAA